MSEREDQMTADAERKWLEDLLATKPDTPARKRAMQTLTSHMSDIRGFVRLRTEERDALRQQDTKLQEEIAGLKQALERSEMRKDSIEFALVLMHAQVRRLHFEAQRRDSVALAT